MFYFPVASSVASQPNGQAAIISKRLPSAKGNCPFCGSNSESVRANGNVNMSGWEDDNPDNERREADKDHRARYFKAN